MEADRKASLNEANEASMPTDPLLDAKITYRIGNKVITSQSITYFVLLVNDFLEILVLFSLMHGFILKATCKAYDQILCISN